MDKSFFKKILGAAIPLLIIYSWYSSYQSQSTGEAILKEVSQLSVQEIESISKWDTNIGRERQQFNIPDKILQEFLYSLDDARSAMFIRSPSPYEKVFIRIRTKADTYDLEFLVHENEDKAINFHLVKRRWFGSSSFTQENFGKFRSKELRRFLAQIE